MTEERFKGIVPDRSNEIDLQAYHQIPVFVPGEPICIYVDFKWLAEKLIEICKRDEKHGLISDQSIRNACNELELLDKRGGS